MSIYLFIAYTSWLIILIILALAMVVFLGTLLSSLVGGTPFVPTPKKIIKKMLEMAAIKKGETICDVGCGDGRIVIYAARHFNATAIGIERNTVLVWLSRLQVRLSHLSRQVTIIHGNIFHYNFHNVDVVTTYLLPVTNARLEDKLKSELKPGARVVSRRFTFPNWKPSKIDKAEKLYLYVIE